MFTKGDLSELIVDAMAIADNMPGTQYCEHCTVAEIGEGEQYCLGCYAQLYADKVCVWLFDQEMDKLAEMVKEKMAVDKGLY